MNSTNMKVKISNFKQETFYEFLDYIKGGMNITPIVAIDFTASNRDSDDPNSLHYFKTDRLNLY